jgi:enoyl-CoA hydratase/carnithine racemase
MTDDLIRTELEEGVLSVAMNRPDKKNALNMAMYGALESALTLADSDDRVRVLLLSGSGGTFTSGNDLADFLDSSFIVRDSPVVRFMNALFSARKPIVAAVEGMAIGVGVTMLLHCDLVYAGEGARFQTPFVNLGLCPEAGSSLLMPRMMGHQRAAELLLLGEPFSALRAREVGIVNELFPDGSVLASARAKALQLAAQPAAAVRMAKALLKRESGAALLETARHEIDCFTERLQSPEALEAFQAFMQHRKPDFSRFS